MAILLRSCLLWLSLAGFGSVRADFVETVAVGDVTLYSDATATPLANGAGEYFFAGRTGENDNYQLRRAVIVFDPASALPPGAVVTSAAVRVIVNRRPSTANPTDPFYLYRATTGWSEGPSDPTGTEGSGTSAQTGDATWLHTSYDTGFWTTPGGDFAATASATADLGGLGAYTFTSEQMLADVLFWLANPAENYGWFLLGEETGEQNARRFISADSGDPDSGPQLVLGYAIVPEPATSFLLVAGVVVLLKRGRGRCSGLLGCGR